MSLNQISCLIEEREIVHMQDGHLKALSRRGSQGQTRENKMLTISWMKMRRR
jgi:hypothetical protein